MSPGSVYRSHFVDLWLRIAATRLLLDDAPHFVIGTNHSFSEENQRSSALISFVSRRSSSAVSAPPSGSAASAESPRPRRRAIKKSTTPAPISSTGGASQSSAVRQCGRRRSSTNFAVALHQEIERLLVRVAGLQALAHQDAQVARKRRIRIVDRLVLMLWTAPPPAHECRRCGRC
jgi:hypothetical protein